MTATTIQIVGLQLALPLALVALNAALPSLSRLALILRSLAVAAVILASAWAGLWMTLPFWTPWAVLALHAAASALAARRVRTRGRPARRRVEIGFGAAALILALLPVGVALRGARMPTAGPDLAMPLGPGRYLVVNGGSAPLLNAHLATREGPLSALWRGQSHAVDIIGIDRFGRDSDGLAPADPRRYIIYGAPVLAPCDGRVALATDGNPDMPVPRRDREHMIGNAVMLACGDVHVLLAHLARGSVAVSPGDAVAAGDRLGRVGNSGNTVAPHLHLHAQRGMPPGAPIAGDPFWFTVGGRFLTRNDRLSPDRTP